MCLLNLVQVRFHALLEIGHSLFIWWLLGHDRNQPFCLIN